MNNNRAELHKMAEYDKAIDMCTERQVLLNKDDLGGIIILYDLETSGLFRTSDILQVRLGFVVVN